jgi:hypothetical protein
MTAGIPGTGIGGVFYLISALLMPLFELYRTLHGQSSLVRWLLISKQWAMALCILTGMWLLGLALGFLIQGGGTELDIVRDVHGHVSAHIEHLTKVNVFHIAPVLISCGTLLFILSVTHILGLIYRPASRA